MNNNLTLSVTLTGDGRQLSGTLKDAQGDVREFSATTERESKKAETALTAPGRQADTVSEHLRGAQQEARAFGNETTQGGRQATQALAQTGREAQTVTSQLDQLKAMAIGVGIAFTAMGVRDFINDTYDAVSSSQQLQASLKTVTGSVANATKAWNELLVFAAETPFTLDQSVQAFIRMQALGLNPTQDALRSFGNTAAAMGEDMMRMVEAVADATTGEFERLKAFGIRSSVEGEQIAFTFQGVTTRIRNSAADISAYLQSIGENQFAGSMADQMATLNGQSANLEDSIYQLYLAIGDAGATQMFERALGSASNTVQFLTDNIDTLTTGAEVMAVLLGGRVLVALGSVTAAKLAATQQTIAYQLALARMAGVSTAAAAGQVALAGATRAAAGAMALVGGPLGAAMLAGGAIFYFREELGLVTPKVQSATERVDDMTSALDANSEAALKNAKAMLEAEQQFQQFRQATLSMEVNRQRQIVADEQRQWDAVGGQQAFGMGQRSEAHEALNQLQIELMDTRNAIEAAGGSVTEIDGKLAELERTTRETITPTKGLGEANETVAATAREATAAANELTKATEAQATALEALRNRLIPGRREIVQLARDMQTLTLAIAMGTGNVAQNIQMMGLLQQQYIDAQNDTDDLADQTVKAAFTMEGAFDELRLNGLRRLDDGFADLWQGAIDGSRSASETMKRVLDQTLAELAHMAFTRPIIVEMQSMMGMAGGQQGGMNSQGMSLQNINPGMLQRGWETASGWFGGASTTSAGYAADSWAGSATGSYTGWAGDASSAAASQSVPIGGGGMMTGVYSAGAGIAGGWAGSEAGSAITGKTANSNYGQMIGTAVGTYIFPVVGTAIGAFIGSFADSLFGSGKKTYDFDFVQGQHSYIFGDETSAFGDSGLTSLTDFKLGDEQDQLKAMLSAMADFDNQLAATAIPERFDAMKASIQGFTHSGPEDLFETRLRTMITGGQVLAADAIASIIDPEVLSQAMLGALQLEGIGKELGGQVLADITTEIEQFTGNSVADAITRMTNAAMAADLLASASQGLNLQFDITAAGAVNVAGSIAEIAGGVQNLAAIQQGYYEATYTETERLSRSQADLRASLSSVTDQVPTTVAELRALVEAQNMNTDAGSRLAVQLMQLAPAMDETNTAVRRMLEQQYQDTLGRAPDAAGMEYWFNQVATGSATLEQALAAIAGSAEAAEFASKGAADGLERVSDILRTREQLERQILTLEGNTAELRRRDLEALDESNRPLQQRVWALQDEQERLRDLDRQQQERVRTINQERDALARAKQQLAGFSNSIDSWLANLQGTDAGLASPGDQLAASSQAFYEQYAKAQGGDRDAMNSITQYADRFIEAQKGWSASGSQTTATIDKVTGMLSKLPDQLSAEQFLADEFKGALAEQTTTLANALDLNGNGTVSALERSIAADWETSDLLKGVLHQEMQRLGTTVLTESQIRTALKPYATDAEISRLIGRVDINGDGFISQQELTNARLGGLSNGIANAVASQFDHIDISADGLIDYDEFARAFDGMATDSELRRIFNQLDMTRTGTISRLDAQTNQLVTAAKSSDLTQSEQSIVRALNAQQTESVVRWWGHHYANEMSRKFSGAGLGLGVTLAVSQNPDGARKIANAFLSVMGPNTVNGSHRTGLEYVPFDGYVAELHRGEKVLTAEDADAMRSMNIPSAALPALPSPSFSLLGNNDVVEAIRDLRREVAALRKENAQLQRESNKHAAAAVRVSAEGHKRQIEATERGNRSLGDMATSSRLERAR